jgi:putative ABC transport system permease protein
MRLYDFTALTFNAVQAHRMRSFLTALGITVGIASVVLLTSLGQGVHRYVMEEFTQFGTNLVAISPGKTSTTGISGAVISNVRPLSLDDSEALSRIPGVVKAVPVVQGNAPVESGRKSRRTTVFGVGPAVPEVWQIHVASGRFLPDEPARTARSFAVLGSRLKQELFGNKPFLGKRVRIGGETYRVIGSMESKGQMLGFDLDDAIYIPISKSLAMFNRESVMEIDLLYISGREAKTIAAAAKEMLIRRHGSEDFTIITQDQMLETLGSILGMLTIAVGALGGISLFVGGVGILTIMTIAVNERTSEIGVLRAVGADHGQILGIFLGEAVVLSSIGGLAGLVVGVSGSWLLGAFVPALPTHTSWSYVLAAELLAAAIGLGAGVLPARRAAALNPVDALRAE